MNYTIFFSVSAVYVLVCIFISRYVSKNMKDNQDYFLGRRSFGAFALTLTLLATQLGGGSLLGASQEAYDKGWMVLFYPLGISLGLVALSMGFGRKMHKLKLDTVAELYERVYESKTQRKIVSIISIFTMFFILIAQAIAAKQFFCSVGLYSTWVFLIFWCIIIIYAVVGGLKAVVYTDAVQILFVMGIFALALFFGLKNIPPQGIETTARATSSLSIPWSAWLLMPLLFMLIEQDMGQRCFAAKSSRTVTISGITSAILLFLCSLFAIFFGTLAKKMNIEIPSSSSVLMTCISKLTPSYVSALFGCAFLMVIITTADALLCSVASNLTFDFPFFKNKDRIGLSKLITFVVGIIAVLCSFYFDKIVFLLILSYEFSVNVLFVPTIAALFNKKLPKEVAFFSMFTGFAGFIFFKYYKIPLFSEVITLMLSYAGYFISMKVLSSKYILKRSE